MEIDFNNLTVFLGWCAVINSFLLLLATVALVAMKDFVINVHGKLLGVEETALPVLYFQYLANYKIAILVFNIVPYIALKVML